MAFIHSLASLYYALANDFFGNTCFQDRRLLFQDSILQPHAVVLLQISIQPLALPLCIVCFGLWSVEQVTEMYRDFVKV